VAFGGEEGEGNGVLGVYVGNIPDGTPNGTPNLTGWAWWAGTSFATPIISGLVAAWVIGNEVASTREAINKLLDIAKQQPNTPDTPEGEWIVPVEQQ
jgi:subtilase family serine protease